MAEDILVPVSVGELIDKFTILAIKLREITDPAKLANVRKEYELLLGVIEKHRLRPLMEDDKVHRLTEVNHELWRIEDEIRQCEAKKDFGKRFIALARLVYRTNDERARLKREINVAAGSALFEEKSFS
jgi:hypothetical protein